MNPPLKKEGFFFDFEKGAYMYRGIYGSFYTVSILNILLRFDSIYNKRISNKTI